MQFVWIRYLIDIYIYIYISISDAYLFHRILGYLRDSQLSIYTIAERMVRLSSATIYIEQSATHKFPADWKPLFASWLPYCASQACQ